MFLVAGRWVDQQDGGKIFQMWKGQGLQFHILPSSNRLLSQFWNSAGYRLNVSPSGACKVRNWSKLKEDKRGAFVI